MLVAAPCAGVLRALLLAPMRARSASSSSSGTRRASSVATEPGCTENARTPCFWPRASSVSAKSAFALLERAYAIHFS
jgi:hypothetical protein